VHAEEGRHQRESAADDHRAGVSLAGPDHGQDGRRRCRDKRADADAVEVHPHGRHDLQVADRDQEADRNDRTDRKHRHDQTEGPPHSEPIGRNAVEPESFATIQADHL